MKKQILVPMSIDQMRVSKAAIIDLARKEGRALGRDMDIINLLDAFIHADDLKRPLPKAARRVR